ncbi:MAG TPA: hypothetical protein VKB86_08160, partial [Pyrinomonadaceae bacterium]|nr:hypothetical protein [Pyrinomonadaceae bacterium]
VILTHRTIRPALFTTMRGVLRQYAKPLKNIHERTVGSRQLAVGRQFNVDEANDLQITLRSTT